MHPDRFRATTAPYSAALDQGLRTHMQRVYNRMTFGVLITALTAWIVSSSPFLLNLFLNGPQAYVIMFAPVAVLWFGFRPTMSNKQLLSSFIAISVLYGISFSVILLAFTGESIVRAFLVATIMFAGLSIFGYSTKKNLDALGTFAVMGVMGVFALSVFAVIGSLMGMGGLAGLSNIIAGVGILAFAGVTAWQTQSLKEAYSASMSDDDNSRAAWFGSLTLYISFIAMFQYILHFIGNRN